MAVRTHGTNGGYVHGCRCNECSEAHREAMRRYYQTSSGQDAKRRSDAATKWARRRLVEQHPSEYKALREQYLADKGRPSGE